MNKKRSKAKDFSEEVMEGEEGDLDKAEMSSLIAAQNKKKKKSGGFQSMGLANEVQNFIWVQYLSRIEFQTIVRPSL